MMEHQRNLAIHRSLVISGEITEESVKEIIYAIQDINTYDDLMEASSVGYQREPIVLSINSGGGSLHDGFALIGAMEMSETPIVTVGIGHIMSMALAIFLAGDFRYGHRFATFMYHEIAYGYGGKRTSHKRYGNESDRLQLVYDMFIVEKSNLPESTMEEVKASETEFYFDAEEALAFGVIDEIIDPTKQVEEEEGSVSIEELIEMLQNGEATLG